MSWRTLAKIFFEKNKAQKFMQSVNSGENELIFVVVCLFRDETNLAHQT
jgi:hypothetical protein